MFVRGNERWAPAGDVPVECGLYEVADHRRLLGSIEVRTVPEVVENIPRCSYVVYVARLHVARFEGVGIPRRYPL